MLHHLALFSPFLYVIFGEILHSPPRKMRLKWRTIFLFGAGVSLIALYGYSQRGNSGEESSKNSLSEFKMVAQARGGAGPGVLVADNFVQPARHVKRKQKMDSGPGQSKSKSRSRQRAMDVELAREKEAAVMPVPAPEGKRKIFPDPISLKPQSRNGKAPPPQPAQGNRPAAQPQPQPQPQAPGVRQPQPQEKNKDQPPANQMQQAGNQQKQPVQSQNVKPVADGNQPGAKSDQEEITYSVINLSVVCCGDRTNETLVMLKSATILAKQRLHFHIFAEDELQPGIAKRLNSWPAAYRRKFAYNLHPISFPPGEDPEKWKKVFKTCATQRLFIPDLLPDVEMLLYVDTDILFIRPIDEIYAFFKKFNATHMAALAPEHEVKNIGWYNRFARHPYYGETGMNSGVMLMHLARMREFGWTQKIVPYYHEYKLKITWGDQDLINILFHYYPQGLFTYECEWNYRPDHCMYSNNCHRTRDHGIAMIHGCRGVYHTEKQPAFKMIYESFRDYVFGADLERSLIKPLTTRLTKTELLNNYCAKAVLEPVTSTLRKYANLVIPIKSPV